MIPFHFGVMELVKTGMVLCKMVFAGFSVVKSELIGVAPNQLNNHACPPESIFAGLIATLKHTVHCLECFQCPTINMPDSVLHSL